MNAVPTPNCVRFLATALALMIGSTSASRATLVEMGDLTVFDTDTRLSWLQVANPMGYKMTWSDAMAWAENLEFAGFDDWRLPSSFDWIANKRVVGPSTTTEMGHLFYTELGNQEDPSSPVHYGPFFATPGEYWLLERSSNSAQTFVWDGRLAYNGFQSPGQPITALEQVWAVRVGQRLPETGATWPLLGFGLLAVVLSNWLLQRRREQA